MMHIRTAAFLLAASSLLLNPATASISLESPLDASHMNLEQTQQINFWTSFRSFSWGLFLGLPGDQMHAKVKNCYNNLNWFSESIG